MRCIPPLDTTRLNTKIGVVENKAIHTIDSSMTLDLKDLSPEKP